MIIEYESGSIISWIFFAIGVIVIFILFGSIDMTITKARNLVTIAIISFSLSFVFWEKDPLKEANEKVSEYFEKKTGEKVDEIIWIVNNKVSIKTFEGNSYVIPVDKSHKGKWIIDTTIYKK